MYNILITFKLGELTYYITLQLKYKKKAGKKNLL